jgi:hypothetical protein
MTDRGFHELECDAVREARHLLGAVEAGQYLAATRRMESLADMVGRLDHEKRRRETLEWVRNNAAPAGEREAR